MALCNLYDLFYAAIGSLAATFVGVLLARNQASQFLYPKA
jgi:hypothetical protein